MHRPFDVFSTFLIFMGSSSNSLLATISAYRAIIRVSNAMWPGVAYYVHSLYVHFIDSMMPARTGQS